MNQQAASESVTDPSSIEDLIRTLSKGLRVLQLYLPNNPVYQQAVKEMHRAFEPVWQEVSELNLDVIETEIRWRDEETIVYSQPDKSESLAWLLFKDGIRSLTLLPGGEDDEIVRFLGTLNRARSLPPEAGDDLLTLLWEEDFEFIRYRFVELALDEGAPIERGEPGPLPPEGAAKAEVAETAADRSATADALTGLVAIEDPDTTLYALTEEELAYLEREIRREEEQDLRSNVVSVLLDVYETQPDAAVRQQVISIVESLIPRLLGMGDFRSVAYLLAETRILRERAAALSAEQRGVLEGLPASLSAPEVLEQLLRSLDEAAAPPTDEELEQFFGELRPQALGTIIKLSPQLARERIRTKLDQAVRHLAEGHPEALAAALEDHTGEGLLDAVRLAKYLKLQSVVPQLGRLLEHPDAEVRLEVTETLARISSQHALRHVERAIHDADREVRLAAVRALGNARHRGAMERIKRVVFGKGLRGADLTEKMAFFEAFGLLAGSEGIAILAEQLRPKGFMRRRANAETRACAAMALGKIATPEAQEVLEETKDDRDPLVRNAIRTALRALT